MVCYNLITISRSYNSLLCHNVFSANPDETAYQRPVQHQIFLKRTRIIKRESHTKLDGARYNVYDRNWTSRSVRTQLSPRSFVQTRTWTIRREIIMASVLTIHETGLCGIIQMCKVVGFVFQRTWIVWGEFLFETTT